MGPYQPRPAESRRPAQYEIMLTGPGREQFSALLPAGEGTGDELARRGLPRPAIAVIIDVRKSRRTAFSLSAITSVWGNLAANISGVNGG